MTRRLAQRDGEVAEGSLAFEVTKPVSLDILGAEITEAMNWRNPAALVAEGGLATASTEEPVVVWVLRDDADTSTVKKAVTAHQGVEESATQADRVSALRAKAAQGEDLSPSEIQVALRLLLTRGV